MKTRLREYHLWPATWAEEKNQYVNVEGRYLGYDGPLSSAGIDEVEVSGDRKVQELIRQWSCAWASMVYVRLLTLGFAHASTQAPVKLLISIYENDDFRRSLVLENLLNTLKKFGERDKWVGPVAAR